MAREMFKAPQCCGAGERRAAVLRLPGMCFGDSFEGTIIIVVLTRYQSCSAQKGIDVVRFVV